MMEFVQVHAAVIALVVMVLGNLFALVWGAATLKHGVGELNRNIVKLEHIIGKLDTDIANIDRRVSRLEGRGDRTL